MPERAIRACGAPLMSEPAKTMVPPFDGRAPVSRLNIVLLPAPLGPINPKISPALTSKLTLLTAIRPPKRRSMPSTCSSGVPRAGLGRTAKGDAGAGWGRMTAGRNWTSRGTMPRRAYCRKTMKRAAKATTSS